MRNRIIDIDGLQTMCSNCKKTSFATIKYLNKNDLDIYCGECESMVMNYREINNGISIQGAIKKMKYD